MVERSTAHNTMADGDSTWVIPVCRGKKKSHEQRRSERLEKLDKAVKSELFMDYTKKERQKHSGDPYDTVLCVICLEQFEDASQIRGLECSHVFHQACVDDWFSRYNEYCPLCHRPIIPGSVSQTPHTLDHRYERPGLTFIV